MRGHKENRRVESYMYSHDYVFTSPILVCYCAPAWYSCNANGLALLRPPQAHSPTIFISQSKRSGYMVLYSLLTSNSRLRISSCRCTSSSSNAATFSSLALCSLTLFSFNFNRSSSTKGSASATDVAGDSGACAVHHRLQGMCGHANAE